MPPMKTEGKCRCGLSTLGRYWGFERPGDWYARCVDYCPACGDHLADDGCAYQMVRKDGVAALEAEIVQLKELLAEPPSDAQIEVGAYELEHGKLYCEDPADEGSDDADVRCRR